MRTSKQPDGAGLVQRPVDLDGGPTRGWAGDWAGGVAVVKDTGAGEHLRSGETSGDDNVVVLSRLVSCEQNRVWLAHVYIQGGVGSLESVCSFHFDQLQLVVLNSEVERMLQPNIWNSKPVSFTCNNEYNQWIMQYDLINYFTNYQCFFFF